MGYRLYVDSTADFPKELLKEFPDITVIPMEIMIEDAIYCYGEDENFTLDYFYSELESGKFADTSQINPTIYEEYFEKALMQGEDILYLCFTSGMSGTINSARLSAMRLREKYPERKVVCLDTLAASVGGGFLLHETAKKKAEGMELDELAEWVTDNRLKVCHWFTVDRFEHLKHGGRVSAASATIGSALNIKPLLRVDEEGKLKVKEKPRGQKQAMNSLLDKMQSGWKKEMGQTVFIGHGHVPERAEELADKVLQLYPDAKIHIAEIGPVIGAHTGPGMLALVYWGNNR